jgi:hypothetical protein
MPTAGRDAILNVDGQNLHLQTFGVSGPSELKTRARLEPGTAAFLEEEGVSESNKQLKNGAPFPNVPLTVIAATDHGPFFKQWESTLMSLQQQLTTLSPSSHFHRGGE